MTLYSRMLDGEQIDWKWCFCKSCRMEWLVPGGSPDAFPKFCPHCREAIDTDVTPHDVLDDVKVEDEPPIRYDISIEASQVTVFELPYEASVSVRPFQELQDVNDIEMMIVSDELTILVNEWVVVKVRMSHYMMAELASFLDDYRSTCADLMADGQQIVNNEHLRRFNNFNSLDSR